MPSTRVLALGYGRYGQTHGAQVISLPFQDGAEEEAEEAVPSVAAPPGAAACGATTTLLTTRGGKTLYAWGTALAGEFLFPPPPQPKEGSPTPIVQVPFPPFAASPTLRVHLLACGPHHVLATTATTTAPASSTLWTWGLNLHGQLLGVGGCGQCASCTDGNVEKKKQGSTNAAVVTHPRPLPHWPPPGEKITCLSTGEGHTLATTNARKLWAWGCGSSGQLGVGPTGEKGSCRPLLVPFPPPSPSTHDDNEEEEDTRLQQVAVGKRHSLLLTTPKGHVFAWGSGLYHTLGHGHTEHEWTPRLVEALEGIVGGVDEVGGWVGGMRAIAAGGWHSVALSVGGDVYGWGWNKQGQLGGKAGGLVPLPRLLLRCDKEEEEEEEEEGWAHVGAGTMYTAAILANKGLYVWGRLGVVEGDGEKEKKQGWVAEAKAFVAEKEEGTLKMVCGAYHLLLLQEEAERRGKV